MDALGLATGVYSFTLEVRAVYTGVSQTISTQSGRLVIVNRSASPLGAGWWVAGLQQIFPQGGDWLWVGSDGSTRLPHG